MFKILIQGNSSFSADMSSSWIFITRQIWSGAMFALYWKIWMKSHHVVGLSCYLKAKLNPKDST